jgi:hypothetical protein
VSAGKRARRATRGHGTARLLPGWLAALACTLAVVAACLTPSASAQTKPKPSADAGADADATEAKEEEKEEAPEAPTQPTAEELAGGRHMLPKDAEVPVEWMPPGTAASPLPSEEIFPPQSLTIRFNHKLHVKDQQQSCKTCHAGAYKSNAASERLLPKPSDTCDSCHDVDHSDLSNVKAGTDSNGQCNFCHLGEGAGKGNKVAPLVIPTPQLHFPHGKHLARNIQCGNCHGKIDELELATRDNLPRMAGCFDCHNKSGAAQGEAKGACEVCHVTQPNGRLTTAFPTGDLLPPRWLYNAGHTADWIERHKTVAASNSQFCSSCHSQNYCTDCHDGRVRNRKVHPNDWLSMHPQAARQDNPRCVSCHQQQTFCGDCHRRVGVARDVASGNRMAGRRFHPPPAEWTTAPRGPRHHAWEAQRNLNACVSCHTERDCATCHATKGISGGQGVNPHPVGFESKCSTALKRNPRPCLVCHQSGDSSLGKCR